ncbi:MAG: glycosyltransferase family 2 protein [Leptolyngbya sp. RL_3_1]|nr:glycosyltransferase family 2 protein [Leptolyngbya sp. RL_3_1]
MDFVFGQVVILIPVHNRKAITLNCLAHLQAQQIFDWCQVVVIDDGSTDGTTAAVQHQYSQVTVLAGDGQLWWTGAIELGMRYAYQQGADYLVWLNDDTRLLPQTLERLIRYCASHSHVLVSAQCYETPALAQPTYGGHYRQHLSHLHAHAAPGKIVECISLSGNLVCLPRSVIDQIGYPPSQQTPHYFGDVLYSWRARQAGFRLILLGDAPAVCPMNPGDTNWLLGAPSVGERLSRLRRPKSLLYPPGYWHFCRTVWPVLGGIVFLRLYVRLMLVLLARLLLPRPLLHRLKATRQS